MCAGSIRDSSFTELFLASHHFKELVGGDLWSSATRKVYIFVKKNVIFSFKVVTFLAPLVALNNTPISGCKWVGGLIVVLN